VGGDDPSPLQVFSDELRDDLPAVVQEPGDPVILGRSPIPRTPRRRKVPGGAVFRAENERERRPVCWRGSASAGKGLVPQDECLQIRPYRRIRVASSINWVLSALKKRRITAFHLFTGEEVVPGRSLIVKLTRMVAF
jgi:hypothetical protein